MKVKKESSLPDLPGRQNFADLRRELDEMVENFLSSRALDWPRSILGRALPKGVLEPSIDVRENGASVVLTAELPGLEEKDVEVSVRDGVLTLKGEKRMEESRDDDELHVTERRYGSFRRTLALPERVDEAAITAGFANGVLTVTMPKKAEAAAAARRIPVGAGK